MACLASLSQSAASDCSSASRKLSMRFSDAFASTTWPRTIGSKFRGIRRALNKAREEKTGAGSREPAPCVSEYVMKANMDAKIGIDMETAMMPFRMDNRKASLLISLVLIWFKRSRKLVSHPKYLTNRTEDKISCVKLTRWSVILLMNVRRDIRDLIERPRSGISTTIRPKPARAL